jgi:metal transporter CNNM
VTAETLTWLGILFCVSQSAMFSGLNLAVFSISRLRLESGAAGGDPRAAGVLALRRDSNFTLTTILWGNVGINVLLTLLAESVLAGVSAFLFSTVLITIVGEILPQAWFSRHALRIAGGLQPVLRLYQLLLAPVAWPSARLLDAWIGPEGIPWFRERELRDVLLRHTAQADTEIGRLEALGASNFLALDDLAVAEEGEPLDQGSIIALPFEGGRLRLPQISQHADDPFLRRINACGRKWVVITDTDGAPQLALCVPELLRAALFDPVPPDPGRFCHRPIIVTDRAVRLGQIIGRLRVHPEHPGDDVIDEDVIIVWAPDCRRIITGSDLLGRLLRRIARSENEPDHPGTRLPA